MTNDELKQATHEAACNVSFYNAAEGGCWRQEGQARGKAKAKFSDLKVQCEARGLDWRQRDENGRVIGYLI